MRTFNADAELDRLIEKTIAEIVQNPHAPVAPLIEELFAQVQIDDPELMRLKNQGIAQRVEAREKAAQTEPSFVIREKSLGILRRARSIVGAVACDTLESRQCLSVTGPIAADISIIDATQQQIDTIEANKISLQRQESTVALHVSAMKTQLADANATLATTMDALAQKVAALDTANQTLAKDQQTLDTAIPLAQAAVTATTNALADGRTAYATGITRMNQLSVQLRKEQAILGHTKRGSADYAREMALMTNLRNDYQTLQAGVHATAQQLHSLTDAATTARATLVAARSNQPKVLATVNADRGVVNGLMPQVALLRQQRDAQQAIVDDLASRTSDLEVEDGKLVWNITSLQSEEAKLKEQEAAKQQLADAISNELTQALSEQANAIKYAKMVVTSERNGDNTVVHVRFRNPGQSTVCSARIGDGGWGETVAETKTADGSFSFVIRPGDGYDGDVKIRLIDGSTGKGLDEALGNYNRFTKILKIDTPQIDFNVDEAGMLSEHPITPDLKIVNIEGNTVRLEAATPHDTLHVWSDTGGLLSQATVTNAGGTACTFIQIVVDTNKPTGDYNIFLQDRVGGMAIAKVPIHIDRTDRTVSILDPSTVFTGTTEGEPGMDQINALHALNAIPMIPSDDDIAHIQSLDLYQSTAELGGKYNLYISAQEFLNEYFYASDSPYAKYSPQNIGDTIQKRWEDGGRLDPFGRIQTQVIHERDFYENQGLTALHDYETGMAGVMQTGVNVYLGVLRGQAELPLKDALQKAVDRLNASDCMQYLANFGIPSLNFGTVLGICRLVFDAKQGMLLQRSEDVRQLQAAMENRRVAAEKEDLLGQLHRAGITGNVDVDISTLSPDLLRAAARINNRLLHSYDSRIASLTPQQRGQFSLAAASQLVSYPSNQTTPSTQQIADIVVDAMNRGSIGSFITSHQLAIKSVLETVGTQMGASTEETQNVFTWITQNPDLLTASGFNVAVGTSGDLFTSMQHLMNGILAIPRAEAKDFIQNPQASSGQFSDVLSLFDASTTVRQDTVVGRMFLDLLQKMNATNDFGEQVSYSLAVQDITAIPYFKIMKAIESGGPTTRAGNLLNLFIEAGYGEIFQGGSATSPQVTVVAPDKVHYGTGETVRVRFDVASVGNIFDHAFAYVVYNGQQMSDTPISIELDSRMYARIPVAAIQSQLNFSHDGPISVQLKIAAWFRPDNGVSSQPMLTAGGVSKPIEVPPQYLNMNILNFSDLDGLPENQKLVNSIIQDYFMSSDPNKKPEYISAIEWRAAIHGTGDRQCKPWLDDVFVKNATGIDLPLNDPNDLSKWVEDTTGHIQKVVTSDTGTNFQTAVQNNDVKSGDIVQMRGSFAPSGHTALIGKIQSDGVWLFDTNFGTQSDYYTDDGVHALKYIADSNARSGFRLAIDGETALYWKQEDDSIRYHFIRYADLNSAVTASTIYRLQ